MSSVTETVDFYNTALRNILDLHAPIKVRSATFSCSAPWYTSELRKMKAAGRALERRYMASGLTVHKQAYRDHQTTYSKSLHDARSRFYSNIIQSSPGNSKQLFSTISHLLQPQNPPLTGITDDHCNNFMDFFTTKIDTIRSSLSVPSPLSVPAANPQTHITSPPPPPFPTPLHLRSKTSLKG